MDRLARRAESDADVRVVAERLVRGLAAPAERRARQDLGSPIVALYLDATANEQRSIADRRHARRFWPPLLGPAIEPAVLERSARATLDDGSQLVGRRRVGQDPWPPAELEDLGRAAEALADVRAEVEVEGHLDRVPAVRASHGYMRGAGLWSGRSHGSASAIGSTSAT